MLRIEHRLIGGIDKRPPLVEVASEVMPVSARIHSCKIHRRHGTKTGQVCACLSFDRAWTTYGSRRLRDDGGVAT